LQKINMTGSNRPHRVEKIKHNKMHGIDASGI